MQLREHPLMTYHGVPNWPPVWMWRGGDRNRSIRGEVGVLRDVFLTSIEPRTRLFLIIEHEGNEYMGCVLFNDSALCEQICRLLDHCRGQTVAQIASLEVGHLL